MQAILNAALEKMQKRIEKLEHHFMTIRTGRANPNQLAEVTIDYYGAKTPLNQIASIQVVEGRQLVIKAYDPQSLKAIEQAIQAANLGFNPTNDGSVVRIVVPALTEQTRRELTKDVAKYAEEAKVDLRNVRRDANELVKKDDSLSEDQQKDALERIQKLTDEQIKRIDQLVKEKDQDIMTV
jgi:ribosome recycling factor